MIFNEKYTKPKKKIVQIEKKKKKKKLHYSYNLW